MNEDVQKDHISKKTVVYEMPGTDGVTVHKDVEYGVVNDDALTMDIYYPPDYQCGARVPAVVIVTGYPDSGFHSVLGCKFKEMGSSKSWGRLIAASGIVAITYSNRKPVEDLDALLDHIRFNAASLGVDESRIGLWASSGNVPLALSVLMREARECMKCAVLCYGYTLDLEVANGVAEASRRWGFVNPCAGKSVDDLPKDIPLFIARAGKDEMPHLNETLDQFLFKALTCNLPVTCVNHPTGPHAFDLFDDGEISCEIIRQILAFMRFHLLR